MIKDLNTEQRQAVAHLGGPLLVIAGAGSGKTRVVTERCAELMRQGIESYHILGLTFTNQAAKEMRERVSAANYKAPLIATFHSFGARVLRESAECLGFTRNFVIYDEDDSIKVVKAVMRELGIEDKKGIARELKSYISSKKNQLDLDDQSMDEVFVLYQQKLKEFQALDFDDLLYLTVRLFQNHPEELLRYQRRYQYVLVDEYQDTNAAQYQILKLLVAKTGNLFVVGDPDQSIYSWRGANIENILNFERDYPGAKVIRLEQNYRSKQIILRAANELIEHNESRFEKKLWSELGEGEKIKVAELFTEKEESKFIAKNIDEAIYSGTLYSEMVVFYRTNAQSRSLEDQLINWGIPYRIIGGLSFYQRKEIKDILAFMRVALSPTDYVSIIRTINLPKRGIGETTLERLNESARLAGLGFMAYLETQDFKVTKAAKTGLDNYLQLILTIRKAMEGGLISDVVKTTIENSGYMAYLKEDPESAQERRENLDELVAKAREFESQGEEATLAAFLEELSLKSSAEEGQEEPNSVSLMTLHNGKGLEFKVVFIAGMEEGLLPHANSYGDPMAMEEERRLCYVGMTRAKEKLTLTSCTFRYLWGTERDCRPSRFLKEISREYIENVRNFSYN